MIQPHKNTEFTNATHIQVKETHFGTASSVATGPCVIVKDMMALHHTGTTYVQKKTYFSGVDERILKNSMRAMGLYGLSPLVFTDTFQCYIKIRKNWEPDWFCSGLKS